MSLHKWLALAAMAISPLSATAQRSQPNPADPDAPAAAIRYESAFRNYKRASDEDETPDKIWRLANDEMERLGGHAGHMTADAPHGDESASGKSVSSPSSMPAMDHGKHHGS